MDKENEFKHDLTSIEWLECADEIKKVSFEKGDTIVLMTDMKLTKSVYDILSDTFKVFIERLGFQKNDLHFIVLEEGMKIGILHNESEK